jgi:hypothetical protein
MPNKPTHRGHETNTPKRKADGASLTKPTAPTVSTTAIAPVTKSTATKPTAAPAPTVSGTISRRKVPAQSLAKAKAAFASFSLSKHAPGATPANHVAPGQSTSAVQRQSMAVQTAQLPPNGTLSVALPAAQLKALLPSYDASKGTVSLDDVMSALQQGMGGHEFFANGNPTLNRLAIQSQVQDIIASALKGGSK